MTKLGQEVEEDGEKKPVGYDLLSISIRDQLKKEQRKSLLFLDEADDMFEILFKYYETIKNYQGNLEDMHNKINTYNEDKEFADKLLMKPKQA